MICVNPSELGSAYVLPMSASPQKKPNGMTSAKIRYAIGLLGDAERSRRALEELARAGIPSSQLKVLVPEHVLGEALAARGADRRLPSFETWTVCRPSTTGPCPWRFDLIGDGEDTETTGAIAACGPEALHGFHRWALQRHAQQLDKHLRDGGAIVLVRLLEDDEEQTVCRTLLRHASGGVQTHEVPAALAPAAVMVPSST